MAEISSGLVEYCTKKCTTSKMLLVENCGSALRAVEETSALSCLRALSGAVEVVGMLWNVLHEKE